MKLKTSFIYQGKTLTFSLDTELADRNYADEPYLYWLVPVPETQKDECGEQPFFEINLWKDGPIGHFKLSNEGKVDMYEHSDDMRPQWEQEITFEYDNPSADAYNLMVMLGEIQNDFARGDTKISPEEIDELYGLAVNLNDYFDNLTDD